MRTPARRTSDSFTQAVGVGEPGTQMYVAGERIKRPRRVQELTESARL